MNKKRKILFVRLLKSSFIQRDLELLNKHFYVKVVDFVLCKNNIIGTLHTLFYMLEGILWADVTFSWFADIHTYWTVRLSKILRKKSIVIFGGYEVVKIPEIEYGALLNAKNADNVRYLLENAEKVLTVDDGLRKDAIQNVGVNGDNIITVPTGYDHKIFMPKGVKENLILTVSVGNTWNRAKLKGLDIFVKSAKILLDTKFVVIGLEGEALKKLQDLSSPNVEFIGPSTQEELISHYTKAKVYCQLSMREGLPNALCEAMLCECVPVGTDVPGIRTAIGDTGFYVPYGDPLMAAEAIKKALKSEKKGKDARERIKQMFPQERRENELVEIIQKIVSFPN